MADIKSECEIILDINKEKAIKDLKEIKEEAESIIKDLDYNIGKLRLKRKDILIVKMEQLISPQYKAMIEKQLKKQLHRKVIVIDKTINSMSVIER